MARKTLSEACHPGATRETGLSSCAALDEALATRAYDIEVLIECSPPARIPRSTTVAGVRLGESSGSSVPCASRSATAATTPPRPSLCNEFAWLVANTEGDLNGSSAISTARSTGRRTTGPFRDTLARVYLAKGELGRAPEAAVGRGSRFAARHNPAVTKQLDVLKAMAAKKKHNPKSEARTPKEKPNPK